MVLLQTGESSGTSLSGTGVVEGTAAARTTVLTQLAVGKKYPE